MKRWGLLVAVLWLFAASALGEGWIVDESLEDEFGESVGSAGDPYVLDLSFVGDCSLGGLPANRGKAGTYTAVLTEKGYDWPFSLVRKYLERDDLTFANNEVVFTDATRHVDKRTVLGAPPANAQAYLHSGIDVVNTANNHCLDYYAQGYADTLKTLDDLGLAHFGTLYPGTKREQDRLAIVERKGVKIGAVGFSYPQTADLPHIADRIKKLREAGCDLVVVSLHWGREVTNTPQSWQFTMARRVIEAGADVIWGHHPHILQQVAFYRGKPILFSTGNFTFGAMQEVDRDTGIFQLRYHLTEEGPQLARFSVIPCRTQGKGDYRPYILTDPKERKAMLQKLIYPHEVTEMRILPPEFAETGVLDLDTGGKP